MSFAHKFSLHKKTIVTGIITVLLVTTLIFFMGRQSDGIISYDEARDTKALIELFEADRYWLTSTPGYSPELMLKYRSPDANRQTAGRLHLKVLREKNELIGFTAYYMLRLGIGKVLFVGVDKKFRGKRYGEKLLMYAVQELKKMGAQVVQLTTRLENYPAQQLYRRVGFDEIGRDDTYVFFEYRFK